MPKRTTQSAKPSFTGDERIVVLHGQEHFLEREYLNQLHEALGRESVAEVEALHVEGKTAELAEVLDELRSFGLMQQHKMVVVDDADPFITAHRQSLERYAEQPVQMATLVLRAGTWNSGWKLHKLIQKVGKAVKCEPVRPEQAQRWLVKRAEHHHEHPIRSDAAALLVERLGPDLYQLDTELSKLAVAAPSDQPIAREQVERLVGRASDEKPWEIQNALLTGRPEQSIAKLHELIELAEIPKEVVSYFIAGLIRKLHHASMMLRQGAPASAVCKQLKVWPRERQQPFLQAARGLGPAGSAHLLGLLVEMDRRGKSGYGEHVRNLERWCIQFCEQLR